MSRVGINKRIADRLFKDRLIREADHRRVVDAATRGGERVEEVLIDLGILDEGKLLKYIATVNHTQFVSTERMSKAKIDRDALRVISFKLATHYGAYPLVLDRKNGRIIVATADPDDDEMVKELSMAAGVAKVLPMVARPAAVAAAIARGYEGDRSLFNRLLLSDEDLFGDDPFERQMSTTPRRQYATDRDPVTGEYRPPPRTGDTGNWEHTPSPSPAGSPVAPHYDSGLAVDPALRDPEPTPDFGSTPGAAPHLKPRRRSQPAQPEDTDRGHNAPHREPPPRPYSAPAAAGEMTASYSRRSYPIDDEPSDDTPAGYSAPPPDEPAQLPDEAPPRRHHSIVPPMKRVSHAALSFGSLTERQTSQSRPPLAADVLTSAPYLESLRVLIGLLENNRTDLRGHSSSVARLVLDVCERIAMPAAQKNAVTLAGYLHDLGKMGSAHLTALNVVRDDWHRSLAEKLYSIPVKLMESVGLPSDTTEALLSMYERMGGGGLPKGLEGTDIPMGARILAVVDVYADLTLNSNNAMGKLMSADEAVALLFDYSTQHEGASDNPEIFDRHIVEVLAKSTSGERIVIDLLADRHRVLIVDPDPEETMVLQLRLAEQGFDVHLARTLVEARTAIEARAYAVIVSEVDLDEPGAGFELKKAVAKRTKGSSWMFLSTHGSRDTVKRAFQLGVDDFLNKPIATEIVVAKLTQMVERQATTASPRGVSGSLSEMGLTDLVQVLWHGRKTCALRVSQAQRKGEIHFDKGRIVNAKWDGVVGAKAFYRILSIGEDGEFAVDPQFVPGEAVITDSPEALLLEGMRLLDEGIVP